MLHMAHVYLEMSPNSKKPLHDLGRVALDVRGESLAERVPVYLIVDGRSEVGLIEHVDSEQQTVPTVHVSLSKRPDSEGMNFAKRGC